MQLRRAFGTIHEGHCHDGWDVHALYLFLKSHLDRKQYTAGAFALEETAEGNLHIQFYVECLPKRPSTMAKDFLVTAEAVFDVVRDADGSWAYCTGTGDRHGEKPAFERFQFGDPVLYGGTAKADLKHLVDLVISGATLFEIMKGNPYSYCVHQPRISRFYYDWNGELK
jgi:hypothetical protein